MRIQRYSPGRRRGLPKIATGDERLWRDWRVRVVIPGQKDIIWRDHIKTARHGWTEEQLDKMLEQVAEHVEKRFPTIEFRLVELAPNSFNFIYHGRKETMTETLNMCPEVAKAVQVAENVCAKSGHHLSTYQNGTRMTPNGPEMQVINFCSACGMSLTEVRGEIDKLIDAAVAKGIMERLQAAAATAKQAKQPAPPAGEPGQKIADVTPINASAAEA